MLSINKETTHYYECELRGNMLRLTRGGISQHDVNALAQKAVAELDWSNSALQHKGLGWIACQFLERAGYKYNYFNSSYELCR